MCRSTRDAWFGPKQPAIPHGLQLRRGTCSKHLHATQHAPPRHGTPWRLVNIKLGLKAGISFVRYWAVGTCKYIHGNVISKCNMMQSHTFRDESAAVEHAADDASRSETQGPGWSPGSHGPSSWPYAESDERDGLAPCGTCRSFQRS